MNSVTERHSVTPELCPNCGSVNVTTRTERVEFEYGEGDDAARIAATVPVRVCGHCAFEYEDEAAESIRHDAVCKHLGYLTPAEVAAIRNRHGFNRAQFAELTKIGVATLARWEKGALIQNPANDRYLRLLAEPHNIGVLQQLETARQREDRVVVPASHRFPAQIERHREEAGHFSLRVAR